ncbi:MAG: hypothetical protein ACKUBY_01230 [Candidatus Moraniibacteriota bacterium]|jgi:hypothetical protein
MEEVFITLGKVLVDALITFYNSKIFFVIKIFLAVYITVLVVDVILLMYLGNTRGKIRELRKGAPTTKTSKKEDIRTWKVILDRLDSGDEDQYKAAILEADQFTYKELAEQGYNGGNFSERLSQIPQDSFMTLDVVRDVHALSKKIIFDKKIKLTKEQAENALSVYEKFLKNIDVL